jgi:RNA polymerase sigma-70 factor (ECF subfamily)
MMSSSGPEDLERFRSYLDLLARVQLDARLQGKVDVSGVVQQTMLDALAAWPQVCQQQVDRQAAWLRRILVNNLMDEIRKLQAGKRDLTRERSLQDAVDASSARLASCLAAEQSSPSQQVQRQEQAVLLAEALAQLPEAQREALVLQHWQGWTLAQIAQHLDRTPVAVAGLLKRGLQKLRDLLKELE